MRLVSRSQHDSPYLLGQLGGLPRVIFQSPSTGHEILKNYIPNTAELYSLKEPRTAHFCAAEFSSYPAFYSSWPKSQNERRVRSIPDSLARESRELGTEFFPPRWVGGKVLRVSRNQYTWQFIVNARRNVLMPCPRGREVIARIRRDREK